MTRKSLRNTIHAFSVRVDFLSNDKGLAPTVFESLQNREFVDGIGGFFISTVSDECFNQVSFFF
jgi:hypothetical protein